MSKRGPGSKRVWWWHISGFEGSEIVKTTTEELRRHRAIGPFVTFGQAKRDAMEYHRAIKANAEWNLGELRKLKKTRVRMTYL